MASLRRVAAHGTKWTAVSAASNAALLFARSTILARFLSPHDFGLIAIVTIVLGLAQTYSDFGISNSIIYHQTISHQELSSLYWLNIGIGIAIFLMMLTITPLIVSLFSEPTLTTLIPLSSVIFLMGPVGTQFQVLLQKSLEFRTIAIIEIASALISTILVLIVAIRGFGVLSYIVGQLSASACIAASLVILGWSRWRPSFVFHWCYVKRHLRFGLYQIGESTANFLTWRADQFIIGLLLGVTSLGYYNFAWNLIIQPLSRINPMLTRVAFPIFSKAQADIEKVRAGYMSLIWIVATINAPLLIGLAVVSKTMVPLLFGSKWGPAIPLLQGLCLVGLLLSLANPIGSLLLSQGRPDLGFKWNLGLLAIHIPVVSYSIWIGGLTGVIVGIVCLQCCYTVAAYWFLVHSVLGRCYTLYIRSIVPPLILASLMGILVSFCPRTSNWETLNLGLQVSLGALIYFLLLFLFERERSYLIVDLLKGGPK